jgi:hypothetical protein
VFLNNNNNVRIVPVELKMSAFSTVLPIISICHVHHYATVMWIIVLSFIWSVIIYKNNILQRAKTTTTTKMAKATIASSEVLIDSNERVANISGTMTILRWLSTPSNTMHSTMHACSRCAQRDHWVWTLVFNSSEMRQMIIMIVTVKRRWQNFCANLFCLDQNWLWAIVLIAACVCPDMQHTCVNKKYLTWERYGCLAFTFSTWSRPQGQQLWPSWVWLWATRNSMEQ